MFETTFFCWHRWWNYCCWTCYPSYCAFGLWLRASSWIGRHDARLPCDMKCGRHGSHNRSRPNRSLQNLLTIASVRNDLWISAERTFSVSLTLRLAWYLSISPNLSARLIIQNSLTVAFPHSHISITHFSFSVQRICLCFLWFFSNLCWYSFCISIGCARFYPLDLEIFRQLWSVRFYGVHIYLQPSH
jgi:hypothetical protein